MTSKMLLHLCTHLSVIYLCVCVHVCGAHSSHDTCVGHRTAFRNWFSLPPWAAQVPWAWQQTPSHWLEDDLEPWTSGSTVSTSQELEQQAWASVPGYLHKYFHALLWSIHVSYSYMYQVVISYLFLTCFVLRCYVTQTNLKCTILLPPLL